LVLQHQLPEAESHFRAALKHRPNHLEAHKKIAALLHQQGRDPEALLHYRAALKLHPETDTYLGLAALFYKAGDHHQAVEHLRRASHLKPELPEPLNNLAWLLATCPDDNIR